MYEADAKRALALSEVAVDGVHPVTRCWEGMLIGPGGWENAQCRKASATVLSTG